MFGHQREVPKTFPISTFHTNKTEKLYFSDFSHDNNGRHETFRLNTAGLHQVSKNSRKNFKFLVCSREFKTFMTSKQLGSMFLFDFSLLKIVQHSIRLPKMKFQWNTQKHLRKCCMQSVCCLRRGGGWINFQVLQLSKFFGGSFSSPKISVFFRLIAGVFFYSHRKFEIPWSVSTSCRHTKKSLHIEFASLLVAYE